MAQYKLENVNLPDPAGTVGKYWGYNVVVKEDGVYAEIPDDLVSFEIGAGRIKAQEKPTVKVDVTDSDEAPKRGRPAKVD